jgi:hypothetical protein
MGLGDVLSGDKPIQVSVSIDLKNAVMIGVSLFVMIVIAGIIIKRV